MGAVPVAEPLAEPEREPRPAAAVHRPAGLRVLAPGRVGWLGLGRVSEPVTLCRAESVAVSEPVEPADATSDSSSPGAV